MLILKPINVCVPTTYGCEEDFTSQKYRSVEWPNCLSQVQVTICCSNIPNLGIKETYSFHQPMENSRYKCRSKCPGPAFCHTSPPLEETARYLLRRQRRPVPFYSRYRRRFRRYAMMWELRCRQRCFTTAKPVTSPTGHLGTAESLAQSRGDWTILFGEMPLRAVDMRCGYGYGYRYSVGTYGSMSRSKAKEGCLSISEGTLKISNS